MTLKIKPHAVDQDSGTFIFPSVLVTDSIITGSVTVFDESVLMGQADAFNFAGDNVEAVMSGTTAHIMVTGTAGGGGGHETGTMVIYDEGDWVGVFEEMRFIGDGVDAYNSGSYVAVSIPSGGASGGTSVTVTTGTFYVEEVLYDVTLGSATGSFIVPGISQEYDHLKIIASLRTDDTAVAEMVFIYFNNDTTASNYRYAQHYAGSGHNDGEGDGSYFTAVPAGTALGDEWASVLAFINDYTDTSRRKSVNAEGGDRQSATVEYERQHLVWWENTNAINQIEIITDGADFIVGSRLQVIGIKETVLITSVEGGGASGGTPVSVTTGTFYVETLLEEVYLESATGSIIMPGISQEYDHLKVIGSLRALGSVVSTNVNIYFNGDDTETNYKAARHAGGNAHLSDSGDWAIIGGCPAGTATAGQFASVQSFISDYTNPTKKTGVDTLTGHRTAANTTLAHDFRTTWESDDAINRIDFYPRDTNDFVSGTWIQLFGLREETVVTSVEGGGGHLTGTMVVYEEDTFLGVFEEMRFIGDGVTALNSGSYAAIAITGSAGGGGELDGSVMYTPWVGCDLEWWQAAVEAPISTGTYQKYLHEGFTVTIKAFLTATSTLGGSGKFYIKNLPKPFVNSNDYAMTLCQARHLDQGTAFRDLVGRPGGDAYTIGFSAINSYVDYSDTIDSGDSIELFIMYETSEFGDVSITGSSG